MRSFHAVRNSRKFVCAVAVAAMSAGLTLGAVGAEAAGPVKKLGRIQSMLAPSRAPGEIVVKVAQRGMKAKSALSSILSNSLGNGSVLAIEPFQTDDALAVVRLADDADMAEALRSLQSNPAVRYAEPNYIYSIVGSEDELLPNDPEFSKLWGMKNTGQADSAGQAGTAGADIGVSRLWAQGLTGSKDLVVAVIDTGIDYTHPDLVDNMWINAGEIAGNNVDDDNNGFVDDVHGYNFGDRRADPMDDHNHGTHCAGTIGAPGNNGIGVAGVVWNVRLMPVKFLTASGSGTLQGAVDAINYARQMGADIMSNSWGGGGFSQALEDAIKQARDSGVLFVAAAGNESNNNDASPTYPAGYNLENVLSVAAVDNREAIAGFSNWGRSSVHVAAPGVKIVSTVRNGQYASYSGTSMATPHVSGIAALLMSAERGWTFTDVKERLIRTSVPVSGLKRKSASRGRVNVYNALNNIVPPSNEPDETAWQDMPYSIETAHPYANSLTQTWDVKVPGARFVRVVFDRVETERKYDTVKVEDSKRVVADELSGTAAGYTSEYVEGDSLTIRLTSDGSVNGYGFSVTRVQYIPAAN